MKVRWVVCLCRHPFFIIIHSEWSWFGNREKSAATSREQSGVKVWFVWRFFKAVKWDHFPRLSISTFSSYKVIPRVLIIPPISPSPSNPSMTKSGLLRWNQFTCTSSSAVRSVFSSTKCIAHMLWQVTIDSYLLLLTVPFSIPNFQLTLIQDCGNHKWAFQRHLLCCSMHLLFFLFKLVFKSPLHQWEHF